MFGNRLRCPLVYAAQLLGTAVAAWDRVWLRWKWLITGRSYIQYMRIWASSVSKWSDSHYLTLSLPSVINFKFPLQPHQKYSNISHSMKNLACNSLLRWKMIMLQILTHTFLFTPFSPEFKKHVLPRNVLSEVVRIGSIIIIFHLNKLCKASSSYCAMLYFWWGCRGNLKLTTLGSEKVKRLRECTFRTWEWNG